MTTIDAILHCDSDVEVYELMNIYIGVINLDEHTLSAKTYPLASVMDVMQQMRTLFIALGLVSRRLDDHSRMVIKEALCIFNAALERLRCLAIAREHRTFVPAGRRGRIDSVHFSEHRCRPLDRILAARL